MLFNLFKSQLCVEGPAVSITSFKAACLLFRIAHCHVHNDQPSCQPFVRQARLYAEPIIVKSCIGLLFILCSACSAHDMCMQYKQSTNCWQTCAIATVNAEQHKHLARFLLRALMTVHHYCTNSDLLCMFWW